MRSIFTRLVTPAPFDLFLNERRSKDDVTEGHGMLLDFLFRTMKESELTYPMNSSTVFSKRKGDHPDRRH